MLRLFPAPFALLFAVVVPLSNVQAQADTIRVGASALASAVLPRGADTSHTYAVRGDQRRLVMTYIEETSPAGDGVLVVGRNVNPAGATVTLDSVMLSRSFAPVWHWDMTPRGRARVQYGAGRMQGTSWDTAGTAKPMEMAVHAGAFDYSMASNLIPLLPLRVGYAAVLATHDITRGPVYVPFRVVGEESVTVKGVAVDAWKVEQTIGPGTTATRWISKATRKDVRTSVTTPNGQLVVE